MELRSNGPVQNGIHWTGVVLPSVGVQLRLGDVPAQSSESRLDRGNQPARSRGPSPGLASLPQNSMDNQEWVGREY